MGTTIATNALLERVYSIELFIAIPTFGLMGGEPGALGRNSIVLKFNRLFNKRSSIEIYDRIWLLYSLSNDFHLN